MQSIQETVLEEFMQRSFGAQNLYIPLKYKKGNSLREPADLLWKGLDFIGLFYLTRSVSSLENQINHNAKQAAGYIRMWSTQKPSYALKGRNRVGDTCYEPYNKNIPLDIFSIVSAECGVQLLQPLSIDRPNAVILIPEFVIHKIADFGGTIVDLIYLSEVLINNPQPSLENAPRPSQFVEAVINKYVNESFFSTNSKRIYHYGQPTIDFPPLLEFLSRMKKPNNFNEISKEDREQLLMVWGDMMLVEYAGLAATAEAAIIESEPPKFTKFSVRKFKGPHYSFVVNTVHLMSGNLNESIEAANEACINELGVMDSINVQYIFIPGINDYRSPGLISLPKEYKQSHASKILERIINKNTN